MKKIYEILGISFEKQNLTSSKNNLQSWKT